MMNVSTLLQEVISYSLVSCPGDILSTPVAVLAALTTASGAMSHVSGSPTGSTETMSEAIGVWLCYRNHRDSLLEDQFERQLQRPRIA